MRTFTDNRVRAMAVVASIAIAAAVAYPAAAPSAPVAIELCAKAGTAALPNLPGGASTVPIWGFALKGAAADCSDVTATIPGPQITADEGDVVTLKITNALPAGAAVEDHAISLEVPGIGFDAGPTDVRVGNTLTRTFTAGAAGTYLYLSAGGAGRQEAMGLSGALVVRPATAGRAYSDASTAYDVQKTLVLGEIDPALNNAPDPDTYDMLRWDPKYWLINGKVHPDTGPIGVPAGQSLLLRYVNAGLEHATMTLLGRHMRLVGQDANALANPISVVAQTLPAGATADGIVTAGAAGSSYPLYNRQLHLTNGDCCGSGYAPGGMMTFINVGP